MLFQRFLQKQFDTLSRPLLTSKMPVVTLSSSCACVGAMQSISPCSQTPQETARSIVTTLIVKGTCDRLPGPVYWKKVFWSAVGESKEKKPSRARLVSGAKPQMPILLVVGRI